jgi:hypothetical protein
MTTTTTTAHIIHTDAEYYVLASNAKNTAFHCGWDWDYDRPHVVATYALAMEYPTLEAAKAEAKHLNIMGIYAKVCRVPARTTATLTAAGKDAVRARRAARNADNKR